MLSQARRAVQNMLGIKGCPAFDVAAACAGFTYALSVADQYVKSGAVKYALVIGADVLARTCDQPIAERSLFLVMVRARYCWGSPKSRVSSLRICMLMAATANC